MFQILMCIQACYVTRWENMIGGGDTTLHSTSYCCYHVVATLGLVLLRMLLCYLECIVLIFLG